jgi:hypothetical protein
VDPLSERDLDERADIMFSEYGGLMDVDVAGQMLILVIGYWHEQYDKCVTVTTGWMVAN